MPGQQTSGVLSQKGGKIVVESRPPRTGTDGTTVLSRQASQHLHAALLQMELLLASEQAEAGFLHLLAMLQHLRSLGQLTA